MLRSRKHTVAFNRNNCCVYAADILLLVCTAVGVLLRCCSSNPAAMLNDGENSTAYSSCCDATMYTAGQCHVLLSPSPTTNGHTSTYTIRIPLLSGFCFCGFTAGGDHGQAALLLLVRRGHREGTESSQNILVRKGREAHGDLRCVPRRSVAGIRRQ